MTASEEQEGEGKMPVIRTLASHEARIESDGTGGWSASITMPWAPVSPNTWGSRRSWVYLEQRARFQRYLEAAIPAYAKPPKPLARATVSFHMRRTMTMDTDNLRFACKPILDALVSLKVLQGDTPEHIGEPKVTQERIKDATGKRALLMCCTHITIESHAQHTPNITA